MRVVYTFPDIWGLPRMEQMLQTAPITTIYTIFYSTCFKNELTFIITEQYYHGRLGLINTNSSILEQPKPS